MTVELVRASMSDKAVLRQLLQLCHYDFSEWNGDNVDEHGSSRTRISATTGPTRTAIPS